MILVVLILVFTLLGIAYMVFMYESVSKKVKRAKSAMSNLDFETALKILNDINRKRNNLYIVHKFLAEIYSRTGKYDLAIVEYRILFKLKSFQDKTEEIETRKGFAVACFENGMLDEAKTEFQYLLKIDFTDNKNYYYLGDIELKKNNPTEAIGHLKKYLALGGEDANAYFKVGCAYYFMGTYDDSLKYLLKSVEMNPHIFEAHYYLGVIYKNRKELDNALKEFEYPQKDIKMKINAFLEKGKILIEKKFFEKAVIEFQKGIKTSGDNKDPIVLEMKYLMADIYHLAGNISEAIILWEQIAEVDSAFKDVKAKLASYQDLRDNLRLKQFLFSNQEEFKQLAADLVKRLGFEIEEESSTIDRGVDFIAKSKANKDNYIVEVLRWTNDVGELTLRELSVKMQDTSVKRALCITTSGFTPEAKKFMERRTIELIDKKGLNEILLKLYKQ